MPTVDRGELADDFATHLASTGHKVDVGERPADAGGDPTGSFVPYGVVYPQVTTYIPRLSSAHAGDVTTCQVSCIAASRNVAGWVARDLKALALTLATADGRRVVQVLLEDLDGPVPDREDERLWLVRFIARIETSG